MRLLLVASYLVKLAMAASRTTPPSGCLTVGSGGTYSTLTLALAELSTTSTSAQCIFVYPGTYTGLTTINARAAALTIYGSTTDTTSYTSNTVSFTNSLSAAAAGSDEASSTIINLAANTKFYNFNIKNTYGKGSQAIALSAYATNQGYYGVGFYGYQDTLLAQTGLQVYAKSYIEGAVDFIFGQHAVAWFDGCDIRVSAGGGAITANGRATSTDVSYYVINKSSVAASGSSTAATGSVFLGRPWSTYARVCFQRTVLGAIINAAGWEQWSAAVPNTAGVLFEEYANTGTGAAGTRASFSTALTAPLAIGTILGSGYASWVDTSYLAAV